MTVSSTTFEGTKAASYMELCITLLAPEFQFDPNHVNATEDNSTAQVCVVLSSTVLSEPVKITFTVTSESGPNAATGIANSDSFDSSFRTLLQLWMILKAVKW